MVIVKLSRKGGAEVRSKRVNYVIETHRNVSVGAWCVSVGSLVRFSGELADVLVGGSAVQLVGLPCLTEAFLVAKTLELAS